jgi:hypothetical protein
LRLALGARTKLCQVHHRPQTPHVLGLNGRRK